MTANFNVRFMDIRKNVTRLRLIETLRLNTIPLDYKAETINMEMSYFSSLEYFNTRPQQITKIAFQSLKPYSILFTQNARVNLVMKEPNNNCKTFPLAIDYWEGNMLTSPLFTVYYQVKDNFILGMGTHLEVDADKFDQDGFELNIIHRPLHKS